MIVILNKFNIAYLAKILVVSLNFVCKLFEWFCLCCCRLLYKACLEWSSCAFCIVCFILVVVWFNFVATFENISFYYIIWNICWWDFGLNRFMQRWIRCPKIVKYARVGFSLCFCFLTLLWLNIGSVWVLFKITSE